MRKSRRNDVRREVWEVQNRSRRMLEGRERLAQRNNVKSEKRFEMHRGISERIAIETYLHGPKIGLRQNTDTAISCRSLGPA